MILCVFEGERDRCKNRDLFVLVGHPKSFTTDAGFKYLLKKTYGKYEYKTLVDIWSRKIKKNNNAKFIQKT